MSLTDWNVYIGNTGLGLSINVLTPILGLGCGRIGGIGLGGGTNTAVINVTALSGRTKGVTRGKLRTLFRYDDFTGGAIGLTFLQSNANLTTGTSNFYAVQLRQADGTLYLTKVLSNVVNANGTTLDSVYFSPGIETVFALEAEWSVDLVELGGVALFVRTGFATDFSDLTTVMTYLDVSSPITTSVAESIFVVEVSAGGVFNVDIDQTALYVPAP